MHFGRTPKSWLAGWCAWALSATAQAAPDPYANLIIRDAERPNLFLYAEPEPTSAAGKLVYCNDEVQGSGGFQLCAQGIQKGEPAPFDGQVLSTDLAITLGIAAEQCDQRVALERDHAERLAEVELVLERETRQLEQQACTTKLDALQRQVAEEHRPPGRIFQVVGILTLLATSSLIAIAVIKI